MRNQVVLLTTMPKLQREQLALALFMQNQTEEMEERGLQAPQQAQLTKVAAMWNLLLTQLLTTTMTLRDGQRQTM